MSLKGHSAISGDILGCHSWGARREGTTDVVRIEPRDAAAPRTDPHSKGLSSPMLLYLLRVYTL